MVVHIVYQTDFCVNVMNIKSKNIKRVNPRVH